MTPPAALSTSPSKENESPFDAERKGPFPGSPTRSNTVGRGLSWQKRPSSQVSERSRSRPLSMVAAENAARTSNVPEPASAGAEPPSRDQIASALSSKDPAWFRQTADRGANSAAYRRSQVEDAQTADMSTTRAQLPGMARRAMGHSSIDEGAPRPQSPASRGHVKSSMSLSNVPNLDPPANDRRSDADDSPERQEVLSPSSPGRRSPVRTDRPASPTKGMGGFVQSAMMKRSDSVSKRWSVRSPPGLQRADSVTSNRSSYEPQPRIGDSSMPRPAALARDSSTEHSRPSSSQGAMEETRMETQAPLETRDQEPEMNIPTTPSKTMDPRRWSPTKASWLEAALNKPESPKPTATPPPLNQPAWMAELQKAKAQKAANPGIERTRSPTLSSHKHQVSIGGLMRSTAPGMTAKPVGAAGLNRPPPSTISDAPPALDKFPKPSQSPITMGVDKATAEPVAEDKFVEPSPPLTKPKPEPKADFRANLRSRHAPSSSTASATQGSAFDGARKQSQGSIAGDAEKGVAEALPKNDFRTSLKARHAPSSSNASATQDVEFKNVFGNLRKTTTKNYVAPDELKDNILRGKAELNITGGPKKTERKDEFKEAILAKKKEFEQVQAEGRGTSRSNSVLTERPLPEALTKRLGRSNTIKGGADMPASPSAPASTDVDSRRSSTVSKQGSVQEPASARSEHFGGFERRGSAVESLVSNRPVSRAKQEFVHEPASARSERFGSLDRRGSAAESAVLKGPSPGVNRSSTQEVPVSKPENEQPSLPALQKETSAPGRLQGKVGGSALANRFNPALAGILARGPPGMAPGSSGAGSSAPDSQSRPKAEVNDNEAGSGPKLMHMTKGRARGPKRKAPTSAASAPATTPDNKEPSPSRIAPEEPFSPQEPSAAVESQPRPEVIALVDSSKKSYEEPLRAKPERINLVGVTNSQSSTSGNKIHEQVAAFASQRRQRSPTKSAKDLDEAAPPPSSPRKLDTKRMSRFLDDSSASTEKSSEPEKPQKPVRPAQSSNLADRLPSPTDQPKPEPQPLSVNKPKRPVPGPISLPAKEQFVAAEPGSGTTKSGTESKALFGARALPATPASGRAEPAGSPSRPLPREAGSASRPLATPEPKPQSPQPGPKSPPPTTTPLRSPTKQSLDTSSMLSDFFGPDRPQRKYGVDAAEVLMNRPNSASSKLRTLKAQLFQFSADGKKQAVPAHRERTLFEREMYLCSHTFTPEGGKKTTEVYFWVGDEIPQSAVEDASIFVSREAKAMGGKLVKLQQGKETPEFLQALGGIVIVQRGSGTKYDSLAPHMLCGRRYQGHVCFDEVDFTPAALCSGFPYLITHTGRCYLWKGRGSGIDELSCARLIGMDYALSGELEEVEDGREPATFWDLFGDGGGSGGRFGSADHWRLKPNYDKYCCRLFCSDAASKQQIVELSPFAQADLSPLGIYVIDAFFELYVVVGARAQPQYASFRNALDFAQEYAILAAGMEDRPFMPVATVVLEGVPRDLKSVFRKWRDDRSPTLTTTQQQPATGGGGGGGLRRGRSLKIVSLNQALLALSD
ncbi:hypothetical protein GGR56DRAFT_625283 [Xylariaceae sp. FL0804]|nr:hypothetical protein GGR56DRAFT_625283 [Xylariaceae sp. FL0804]